MSRRAPATPLPWSRKEGHFQHVRTEDIDYFIHAANSYPRLVEALRLIFDLADENAKGIDGYEQIAEWSRSALRELGEEV